ncbi:E3 SUMO-protein ligase SIZ1 [Heracleum sosnowskyi]|uniref:E3 SUMO-protein ligase SIZ1 n=1 Tax=Heracleum sosnowskyi TaxID=360622 RepID=A0AAD8J992_9APIA|nr:E3 SUMO-protein ligase SIZ1 [Heracleum sosnowskyi]
MDMELSCKDKLAFFRVKELKDVLTHLGLSKQGKKQDLVDRILAIISDEQVPGMLARKEVVAELIDDTYRKMHFSSARSDLEPKGKAVSDSKKAVSDSSSVKRKEPESSYQMEKIRCPCGSSLQDSLIQCEDSRCNIWQHIGCVIIPEKSTEGVVPVPSKTFYCELCRLSRADPFWVTIAHPLYPAKLATSKFPTDGTNPVQSIEKSFQLTRADKDLLAKSEYDVQAWCILLNDKVSFRLHWPQYADLQVNGVPVRAINRPGSQLLGANGRDDGPVITPCTKDGVNKISLTGCDARVFCMGVRIARRRTVQQILSLIPKECDGERFEDSLARVCHCVGGGAATKNADSDSDLEVVADSIVVKLCCPMSGLRMKVAGRFKPCVHMGCFDLDVFLEMNQRTRKWQCPICLKNYSLENVIIDPYFNRITSKMRTCGEDATEIEVKPDGSWRVKPVNERRCLGDLTHWHFPDGSLCMQTDKEAISKSEVNKVVKHECTSEGHTGLKLGIKKNINGIWQVSKPGDSSVNRREDNIEKNGHIIMSSSITGSGRDGEDPSVNQEGGINFDFSTNNAIELDSVLPSIDPVYEFTDQIQSAPVGDADVIILSDSEEENDLIVSSGPIYKSNGSNARSTYDVPAQGISDSYPGNFGPGPEGDSCLEYLNDNDGEFGVPLPSADQGGPSFQLFGSKADISGALNCYSLNVDTASGSTSVLPDSSLHNSTADINDSLVDNPLVFSSDDPSLQSFISSRPSSAAAQTGMSNQPNMSNGISTEDWISLRTGNRRGGACDVPPAVTGSNPQKQLRSREGAQASFANTASLLSDTNDDRSFNLPTNGSTSANTSRQESGPFTFPRQRRSVRPRLYHSVDSDSE